MSLEQSRRIERFKRLTEINRAITASLDFDELLRLIVTNASELVSAQYCLLLIADNEGQLRIRAARGIDADKASRFSAPMEESVVERLSSLIDCSPDRSLTAVPVLVKNSLNGLLAVACASDLTEEDRWLLAALADQAAITLSNARLHEMEVEQRRRESALLAEVTRKLSALLDLGDVMRVVCGAARDLVNANGASFVLLEKDEVHYADVDAVAPLWRGQRFHINQCISGWAVKEHVPAIVEDIYADERIPLEYYRATFVKSLAIVPMKRDKPLGAIGVYWAKIHRASDREVELLEALADSASIALINSRLYEEAKAARHEAEQRTEALLRLEEASVGLLASNQETPTYDRLIEIICHVTRAPRGVFWLLEESEREGPGLTSKGVCGLQLDEDDRIRRRQLSNLTHLNLDSASPSARAARAKRSLFIRDLNQDPVWLKSDDRPGSDSIRSVLSIPLRARGELLGVVSLYWHYSDPPCDEATIHIAEVISNQIAAALDAAALVKELSRASRIKDEFLATLSHELRNPLNVIIGYSEILSRNDEAQKAPMIKRAIEVIHRNALAQSQLVSDLLDLSRFQTGKLALNIQPVALGQIITDAAETVRADAKARQITLMMIITKEPLVINADAVRVQQIAWNLLNNAVKFTPDQGRVMIRLEREAGHARLTVEDNGQGIEPDFLPYVFDMFRQADASTVRRHGGMGIGLALVRQLAELHGGRVDAHSDGIGRGARFVVRFPLQTSADKSAQPDVFNAEGALYGKRILVVDDSRDTTDMLRHLLKAEGAKVETATSGAEALQIAETRVFDIIFSDISMPEMDGYDLLDELRKRPQTAHVPAIALTGFEQLDDSGNGHRPGFFAHITKPINLQELIETAREAMKEGMKDEG